MVYNPNKREVSNDSRRIFTKDYRQPLFFHFLWIILILADMYLARKPSHRCMASFNLIIRNSMRLFATSVKLAEKRLNDRNRDVLLSAGRQHAERCVEREFERISTAVQRD